VLAVNAKQMNSAGTQEEEKFCIQQSAFKFKSKVFQLELGNYSTLAE
jgi:hypothetical protein